jgi:hypothetical protein
MTDDDGAAACFQVPDRLVQYLGQTVTIAGQTFTLPTADQCAADELALPSSLRAAIAARRARMQGLGT